MVLAKHALLTVSTAAMRTHASRVNKALPFKILLALPAPSRALSAIPIMLLNALGVEWVCRWPMENALNVLEIVWNAPTQLVTSAEQAL